MNLLTYPYSRDASPPIPVVELGLSRPGFVQAAYSLTAIVDSAADGTLIPMEALKNIGARRVGNAVVRGISDPGQRHSVYLVSLHIGPHALHAIRVLAMPVGSDTILGRNALQHLILTLNGPAGVTEIDV